MLESRVKKKSKLLEPLLATEIKIGRNRPGLSYSYIVKRHVFLLMVFGALESDPAVPGLDGSAGHHRTQTMHQSHHRMCMLVDCGVGPLQDHYEMDLLQSVSLQPFNDLHKYWKKGKCKHPVNSYTLGNSFGANSRREHTDEHTPENHTGNIWELSSVVTLDLDSDLSDLCPLSTM